jgi:hypothetical protein
MQKNLIENFKLYLNISITHEYQRIYFFSTENLHQWGMTHLSDCGKNVNNNP